MLKLISWSPKVTLCIAASFFFLVTMSRKRRLFLTLADDGRRKNSLMEAYIDTIICACTHYWQN